MAVTARQNLFNGVNPYLQSLLQTPGTREQPSEWRTFHGQFIVNLTNTLNSELPSNYVAKNERSLQLWGESDGGIFTQIRIPDVSIFHRSPIKNPIDATIDVIEPTRRRILEKSIDPDQEIPDAVLIYERAGSNRRLVLRIELLSPSNKRGGEHERNYRLSRDETLKGNVPLLEIDFLHESGSPIPDAGNYPFYIAISDPRTDLLDTYEFNVNDALPAIHIPLAENDVFPVQFEKIYQLTYEIGRWGDDVDYEGLPKRLQKYSEADQQRIKEQRETILQEQK